jgi:photosystem II stability/assembly factor-like uncharacterized protein
MVSTNGGRRFRERLAGAHDVDGVAVSAEGKVFVVRGRRLGTLTTAGDERWRTLPFRGEAATLAAWAGRLVWIGEPNLVAVSSDEGATWAFQRPKWDPREHIRRAVVGADGQIAILTADMSCQGESSVHYGPVGGGAWKHEWEGGWPERPPVLDGRGREYDTYSGALRRDNGPDSDWVYLWPHPEESR